MVITFRKANAAQKTELRRRLEKEIEKVIGSFDLDTLIIALSTSKPQREMVSRLKKVYPLKFLEINKIEFAKKKTAKKEKKTKEKKEEVKEEKPVEEKPKKEKKSKKEKTSEKTED